MGDFAKMCGLLRIYELYILNYFLDTRHTPVGCLQNSYAETRHRRSLDLLYHPDCRVSERMSWEQSVICYQILQIFPISNTNPTTFQKTLQKDISTGRPSSNFLPHFLI